MYCTQEQSHDFIVTSCGHRFPDCEISLPLVIFHWCYLETSGLQNSWKNCCFDYTELNRWKTPVIFTLKCSNLWDIFLLQDREVIDFGSRQWNGVWITMNEKRFLLIKRHKMLTRIQAQTPPRDLWEVGLVAVQRVKSKIPGPLNILQCLVIHVVFPGIIKGDWVPKVF